MPFARAIGGPTSVIAIFARSTLAGALLARRGMSTPSTSPFGGTVTVCRVLTPRTNPVGGMNSTSTCWPDGSPSMRYLPFASVLVEPISTPARKTLICTSGTPSSPSSCVPLPLVSIQTVSPIAPGWKSPPSTVRFCSPGATLIVALRWVVRSRSLSRLSAGPWSWSVTMKPAGRVTSTAYPSPGTTFSKR